MPGGSYAAHAKHAACNDRGLCVPGFLHDEFVGKANGDESYVRRFYDAALSMLPPDAVVGDDSLVFWRAAWKKAHPSQDGKGLSAMRSATEAFIASVGGE